MGLVNWVVPAATCEARLISARGPRVAHRHRPRQAAAARIVPRDPRAMIEELMRAQSDCMASWEIAKPTAPGTRARGALLPRRPRMRRFAVEAGCGHLASREVRPSRPPPIAAMASDFILETEGLTKEFRGFVAVNGRRPARPPRDDSRADRPQWRGQDHLLQPAHALPRADARAHPLQRARHHGLAARRDRAARPRALLSDLRRLPASHPARERADRACSAAAGRSFDFWRSETVLSALDDRAMELLGAVGLAGFAATTAVELPYGRKRALEIATTLALDPEMMLLDEPTAGMGHEDVERIAALIKQVAVDRTVLMVEHNLSVVENLSQTITVLARGEVLAEGDYAHRVAQSRRDPGLHGGGRWLRPRPARAPRSSPAPCCRCASCTPGTTSPTCFTGWTSTCGPARS